MRTTALGERTVWASGLGYLGMSDITLTADELAALDPLAGQVAGRGTR